MSSSRREAGRIKMPHQMNAVKGSPAVCMQRASSAGSNESIGAGFMIRRYICLKGQSCLKQTAEDICKYHIIYVLYILKLEKMNKHT